MMRAAIGLLALLLMPCAPLHAQERPLAPIDEAELDATWTSFRARLRAAVEQRDLDYVLGVTDRDVRNGSDSPRGIEEFRAQWHLNGGETPFWRELGKALDLGSAWLTREDGRPRELCAPYVLARWPRDLDFLRNGVVIVREAPVRAGPSTQSQTIATMAYVVVPVLDWEVDDIDAASKQKWVRVRYRGREGYVAEEHMRSPVEHAACFLKTAAGWRLIVFGPAGRD